MDINELKKTIYTLEKSLLSAEVRVSAEKIGEVLSEDFFEFCSSGRRYDYEAGDVFDSKYSYRIKDFEIKKLGEYYILATYCVVKEAQASKTTESLRSSVWQFKKGSWKMLFHQGTSLK